VIQSNAWNSIFSSLCPTPDQMDFVSLSNYTARTAIWGQGPPLVILPGIAGGFELMGPVIEELSKSFKIYSFQYRGEDNFFSVRNCISFSDFEQDLDEILAFWRLEKPNIFGASFGGALALKYALNNPNKLGSVITQGTGIKYERGIIQRLASMILSYYQVPETNPFVNQFFRLFLGGKSFSDEQIESIARVCWSTDQAVIRGRLRILKQFDLTNCKKKIKVPTLFLKGQKDILLSHDNFAQLQDLCVNNEMHIIGKLGHLAFFQSPKLIAKIIHDFISDKVECINFAYHP